MSKIKLTYTLGDKRYRVVRLFDTLQEAVNYANTLKTSANTIVSIEPEHYTGNYSYQPTRTKINSAVMEILNHET